MFVYRMSSTKMRPLDLRRLTHRVKKTSQSRPTTTTYKHFGTPSPKRFPLIVLCIAGVIQMIADLHACEQIYYLSLDFRLKKASLRTGVSSQADSSKSDTKNSSSWPFENERYGKHKHKETLATQPSPKIPFPCNKPSCRLRKPCVLPTRS